MATIANPAEQVTMFNGVKITGPLPAPLLLFVVNAKNGATCWVEISRNVPVTRLKRYVELKTDIPKKEMCLIRKGEVLVDDTLIGAYGMENGETLTLLDARDAPEEMRPLPPESSTE